MFQYSLGESKLSNNSIIKYPSVLARFQYSLGESKLSNQFYATSAEKQSVRFSILSANRSYSTVEIWGDCLAYDCFSILLANRGYSTVRL